MIIYPAIDIINKKCVRLKKGDYDKKTTYDLSPLKAAAYFEKKNVTHLHVVDLDAAKNGVLSNYDVIREIIEKTSLKVEACGGIRSREDIRRYVEIGADRVSIGTVAIENFDFLQEMTNLFPGKISLSLDIKDDFIYIKGWRENTNIKIWDFLKKVNNLDISGIVTTDIERDGTLTKPNFCLYKRLMENTDKFITASGGIGSKEDVFKLNEIGVDGCIVGKAIYENKIKIEEILC